MRQGADVGKLSAIAERIRDTKKRLDDEADKLAARLDDIDAASPKAFDRGHAFIKSQQSEVDEIESTLRQLSNLPLDGSDGSQDLQPALPVAPKLPAAPTLPPVAENAQSGTADDHNAVARGIAGAITAQAATPTGLGVHRSFPAAAVSRAFGE